MKISTWNVNSINARLSHLLDWLTKKKPDVVLLQELKCTSEAFPYEQIEDLGYNIEVHGQKTYNGVAILSKFPLSDVIKDFPLNPIPDEARYIEALVNLPNLAIRIASVYVPNGQDLSSDKYQTKLKFFDSLKKYYMELVSSEEMIIIGGDFNVAHSDIDSYDPKAINESICFSTKEREALRKFLATGLIDIYRMLNQKIQGFTWWDYRGNSYNRNHGLRIDYLFSSPEVAQVSKECYESKEWREKDKPSDHIPVTLKLDLKTE
ncbi:MAG: exodeoxyribonuclease III [Pseudomonadota bacterium]